MKRKPPGYDVKNWEKAGFFWSNRSRPKRRQCGWTTKRGRRCRNTASVLSHGWNCWLHRHPPEFHVVIWAISQTGEHQLYQSIPDSLEKALEIARRHGCQTLVTEFVEESE